ncbi:MAG: FMN-binding protein [Thermodesulfobacteriota bacterium]
MSDGASGNIRSLLFAGAMCVVVSLLLTAAATGLRGFQERNVTLDRYKNILKSVDLIEPGKSDAPEAIQSLYSENIRHVCITRDGEIVSPKERGPGDLSLYLYAADDGAIRAYIIPIESRGLWGKIKGYLALDDDGSTIQGFTVYQHNETPGLGGEIESDWFQEKFEGKRIVDKSGDFVSVSVAKGQVEETVPAEERRHWVDGISGATLTGKFLSGGIRETLRVYEPISIRFRNNRLKEVPEAAVPGGGNGKEAS